MEQIWTIFNNEMEYKMQMNNVKIKKEIMEMIKSGKTEPMELALDKVDYNKLFLEKWGTNIQTVNATSSCLIKGQGLNGAL